MGSEATLAHAQTEVLLAKLARGKGSRFIYIYILKTSKGVVVAGGSRDAPSLRSFTTSGEGESEGRSIGKINIFY